MNKLWFSFLIAMTASGTGSAAAVRANPAREEVTAAIAAMGGEQVLASVRNIEFDAVGHRNMLEQSLRPDGPWWQDYFQIDEVRDFSTHGERIVQQHRGYSSPDWWLRDSHWDADPDYPTTLISNGAAATVADGKYSRASSAHLQDAEEDFAFGPIGLLHTAIAAPDLHAEADVLFHGFKHHVVAFTWQKYPVRVYLNTNTNLPELVEWTCPRPFDVFWNVWGDVTTRIVYGMWSLEPDGLRYPRQWSIERNGLPDSDFSITSLIVNPAVAPGSLDIPADARRDFLAHKHAIDDIPLGTRPAAEIEPGVIHIPGAWNVNLIRQQDGVVVLEGPISSGYSMKVLDEAHKRFPDLPVKAVITTSDSWPHIGGLREYAARGIPIYALDLDQPVLARLFNAPHTFRPDDLQKHPHAPDWHLIRGDTRLGSGPNRLELIPYRSETGERQTMVYFPQYKLLYTSDLFAPAQGNDWFTPEYLLEMRNAVTREHLAVDDIFGMHYDVTPWQTVTAALDQFLASANARKTDSARADPAPATALAQTLQPLSFFKGQWDCAGKFVQSGKPIRSGEVFTADLAGHWLAMRHGYVFDNGSGIRRFTSPGWQGDRLVWTDAESTHGATDRFVFERDGPDHYRVTYAVRRGGGDWKAGDTLSCARV